MTLSERAAQLGRRLLVLGIAGGALHTARLWLSVKARQSMANRIERGGWISRLEEVVQVVFGRLGGRAPGTALQLRGTRLHDVHLDSIFDFAKASLDDAVLENVTFSDRRFYKAEMRNVTLLNTTFDKCTFDKTYLQPKIADGTRFISCSFRRTSVFDIALMINVPSPMTLRGAFDGAAFESCSLAEWTFEECSFQRSRFAGCDLQSVSFAGLSLVGATFEDCDLSRSSFAGAQLISCQFRRCDLSYSNWSEAQIGGLNIADCRIYGMSLWGTSGEVDVARGLELTKPGTGETSIEVDGLHIGIFVESLLHGNGVRDLVDGLTSTMVLLLGRFTGEPRLTLDLLRDLLRDAGYTPVVFDTGLPTSRDATETVQVLGRLARFVIADVSSPKSTPHEIQQFVKDCQTPTQVVTIAEDPFSMFSDMLKYPWVLPPLRFANNESIVTEFQSMMADLEEALRRLREI